MDKKIIATAALLGMLSIILGAFGSHALKKFLEPEQLASFETGVKYQMYHVFFLLFLGLNTSLTDKTKNIVYNLTLIGVILFSGSIYLLATKKITNIDISAIGIATPIGGLFLISAWFLLFYKYLTKKL
jgi:uncharacterized membrane protein YgdD (TMEM256/DUF423 family)